jgi:hypothetical protein
MEAPSGKKEAGPAGIAGRAHKSSRIKKIAFGFEKGIALSPGSELQARSGTPVLLDPTVCAR